MTVKEIIKLSAEMAGESEVVNLLSDGAPNDITYAKKVKDLLLRCNNLIIEEIATEYFPQKHLEKITAVEDGKIYFSMLSKSPFKILRVFAPNGQKVPYKLVNDYILVNRDSVSVEYLYRIPAEKEDDESYFSNTQIGPYVLAYGICAQYLTERGRISESEIFQEKYMNGLRGRLASKGNIQIPKRRWA